MYFKICETNILEQFNYLATFSKFKMLYILKTVSF